MKDNNVYSKIAQESTKRINAMEDKVAKELYGCTWDELDEDENYIPEGIKTEEDIRNRFSTLEEAISYAVNNEYSYITI